MKSFIRLLIAVAAVLSAAFMGANLIINNSNEGGSGRPYRVEADRIALKIEKGEDYSLSDYSTITAVEKQTDAFKSGNSDYLVKEINGELYRFDYEYNHKSGNTAMLFNICFGVAAAVIFGVLFWIYFVIIRPFNKISGYPAELGNLIAEHIGSPKGIQRMISYLYHERPDKVELIVDEMLAIKSDVDRWRELKETEQTNIAYNNVLNSGLDD